MATWSIDRPTFPGIIISEGEKGTQLPSRLLLHPSQLLQNVLRTLNITDWDDFTGFTCYCDIYDRCSLMGSILRTQQVFVGHLLHRHFGKLPIQS